MAQDTKQHNGIEYAPGVTGKFLFRVREAYVAGSAADLIRSRRVGALKLDLVLRGLALLPEHSGDREPGHVLRHRGRLSYQVLHDLCRDPARFAQEAPHDIEDDPAMLEKKRTWVREQLQVLEGRQLMKRSTDPKGCRPEITVLRDRGDGEPFDDPGATATAKDGYVTISGAVLSSPHFREWGAPEVVAYLCAMTADRFARHRDRKQAEEPAPPGTAAKTNTSAVRHSKCGDACSVTTASRAPCTSGALIPRRDRGPTLTPPSASQRTPRGSGPPPDMTAAS